MILSEAKSDSIRQKTFQEKISLESKDSVEISRDSQRRLT